MKKLLLYLMTLLVFGAVPVSSFAQTRYLKVPTEKNNWDNGSGTAFDGSNYTATRSGVEIGTSKFGISVWNGSANTWYKTTSNQIRPGQQYTLQTNGTAQNEDQATVKSKSVLSVVGAVAEEKYDVQVRYANSSYSTAYLTLIPDYSYIKCTFGHKNENDEWGQNDKNLAKDGTLTYRFNTLGQGGFNITLDRNGTKYTFPAGTLTTDNFSDNQYVYQGEGYNKWCTDLSKNYISGLKTNTNYEVTIDFLNDTMVIREIPIELYITGDPAGGWETTSFAKDEYKFSFENGKYVYEFDYDVDTWFAINEGSESKKRWYVQSNYSNLSLPVEGATLVYTDYDTNKIGNSFSGRVRVTVDWDAKKAWIEKAEITPSDFIGYQVRVHYGSGNISDYQTVTQENLVTDDENGDKWIIVDRGFLDRGLENVGESYDGLGLGYNAFCVETLSPSGERRYWAYGDAKDYGAYVDNGLPMKAYSTKQEAMAQNMHMAETAGNANSRYDVAFNLTDNMMTASLNQIWADSPNQMYLYCLDADEYSKGADGNYSYDADKINIANILSVINNPSNNKVFAFTRSREGLYENVFMKDNKKDLPDGTVFCIIGRTGQIYNLMGENNSFDAFQLTADNWDVFRHELTRDPKQAPAVVATGSDLLLDIDCYARVRTPNTLEGDDANENYMLTFTRKVWSPVKFTLTTDANATEGHDFTKVDDELFTLDDENFSYGTKLYLKATLENGDIVSYGTDNNVTITSDEYDANIYKDKSSSMTINTNDFETGSRVSIEWNNGSPIIIFSPRGEKKTVKIFFIDRDGWGSVNCYNYSDAGLTSKGQYTGDSPWNKNENWDKVEVGAAHRNGAWPGVSMTLCNMNILRQGVEMKDTDKIFEIDLEVEEYSDGTYSRPKLIFSKNGASQTKNLYLVDGGIYSNSSPAEDVEDEDGTIHNGVVLHPATVYMPRMQYNYMDNPLDQSVSEYPNDFHDSDYVEIFVNVPEFTDWVAHGKEMAVDIVYNRDGEEFHATGIPGTHKLYAETVNGKNLLRVAIAKDVIPNNSTVNLRFWPLDNNRKSWEGYFNDGSDHEVNGDLIDSENHNGSHENCTRCTDSKGITYNGDHFTCWGSLCPLEFVGVNYKDGNVYQRYLKSATEVQDPVVTVIDVLKPDHLYIVTDDITSFEYARKNGFVSGTKEKVGNFNNCYELLKTDPSETGKLNYLLPRVYPDAKLYLVAVDDGNVVSYSRPTATAMKPGNPYKYFDGLKTNFTINNSEYLAVKNFDMTIYWLNNEIGVTANKTQADFTFVEYVVDEDEEGTYEPREGGAICLPGHTDTCLEDGNNHLTKIYFQYAAGYDLGRDGISDYSRLNQLKVELRRNTEYEKYFPANGMNKKAQVVRDDNGVAVHVVQDSYIDYDDPINNKPGIAYLNVIGFTANLTTLHIEQTETDTQFQRSAINIPVRIFPTIESIGLTINDMEVSSESGIYAVKIPTHAHNDGDVKFGDRLQFEALMAEYKLDNKNILSYSWAYDPDVISSVAQRPQSRIVADRSSFPSALHIDNAETDPFTSAEYNTSELGKTVETTPFSIYNAPKVALGTSTTPSNIYLKINQNGISSPLYKVAVSRDADVNIPTEVEEILGADEEVAPVYYNLNGVRVDAERLEPGIYVKVTGTKSEKVYVK